MKNVYNQLKIGEKKAHKVARINRENKYELREDCETCLSWENSKTLVEFETGESKRRRNKVGFQLCCDEAI